MHRTSRPGIALRLLLVWALAAAVSGCVVEQPPAGGDDFQSQISVGPAETAQPASEQANDLSEQAAAFADRVSDADNADVPEKPRRRSVEWIDTTEPRVTRNQKRRTPPATARRSPRRAAPEPAPVAAPDTGAVESSVQPTASRAQLFEQLRDQITDDESQPMLNAMLFATLAAVEGEGQFDAAAWTQLDDRQQRKISRYHQLLVALRKDAATGEGALDADAIAKHLDRLNSDSPIEIRTVKLVKTVYSFGVYDPFAGNNFVAGRENPLIVYVELGHFRVLEANNGLFQVHLAQELELYTATGGTMVWQQPAEDVLDECRNRRKDFFVRQLVRLPANLSVGKYLLKVRVTDRNGSSIDERSIPVVLVADSRLVADK